MRAHNERSSFIQSANANAANANATANAALPQFCHSNRARTRTRKSVDGFLGGAFFIAVRDKIWSFGIMASTVFVRKATEEEKEACVSARNFTAKKYKNYIFILQNFINTLE